MPRYYSSHEFRHFASTSELAAWCLENKIDTRREDQYDSDDGTRCREGINILINGDSAYVNEANALLDDLSIQVDVPTYKWDSSIVGAFPNVPAYISGDPECMWYRAPDTSDKTPVRVFVGITSTWSIAEHQLRKRGVALAAFAIALSRKRPVYITPYYNAHSWSNKHKAVITWDLVTSPLVLSELLGCVSNPAVTRHVGIPVLHNMNRSIEQGLPFANVMREDIPIIAETDIFLPPAKHGDPLLDDPVAWIKSTLANYSEESED